MQLKSVKILLGPLLTAGHRWQYISINGQQQKPPLYFSGLQWFIILISIIILYKLPLGLSKDVVAVIMAAFAISVSLFMSLLVSIFDKFEKTDFTLGTCTEDERDRLVQKSNFFKRFISITSYLVVLSIVVIILCSLSYIFNIYDRPLSMSTLTFNTSQIDIWFTIKGALLFLYRVSLNYFLLNYLLLTFFITGSAFEYYMSEMNNRKIPQL